VRRRVISFFSTIRFPSLRSFFLPSPQQAKKDTMSPHSFPFPLPVTPELFTPPSFAANICSIVISCRRRRWPSCTRSQKKQVPPSRPFFPFFSPSPPPYRSPVKESTKRRLPLPSPARIGSGLRALLVIYGLHKLKDFPPLSFPF